MFQRTIFRWFRAHYARLFDLLVLRYREWLTINQAIFRCYLTSDDCEWPVYSRRISLVILTHWWDTLSCRSDDVVFLCIELIILVISSYKTDSVCDIVAVERSNSFLPLSILPLPAPSSASAHSILAPLRSATKRCEDLHRLSPSVSWLLYVDAVAWREASSSKAIPTALRRRLILYDCTILQHDRYVRPSSVRHKPGLCGNGSTTIEILSPSDNHIIAVFL